MENQNNVYSYKEGTIEMLWKLNRLMFKKITEISTTHKEQLGKISEVTQTYTWQTRGYFDFSAKMDFMAHNIKLTPIPDYIPNNIQEQVITAFNDSCLEVGMTLN